jgi:2-haloacid dehalogenase
MARSGKHVVFDVVVTCVSYDAFFDAVKARMGDRLRAAGIKPKLFGFAWMEAAEREYSYLDRCGRYMPFSTIFQPMFYRILWMAGAEEPREFATDDDASFLVTATAASRHDRASRSVTPG